MNELLSYPNGDLSKIWAIVGTSIRIGVGAFFLLMAYRNLGGDPTVAADFERWGYTDGFRRLTGWIQIVGALALLVPQTCFWGGGLLACVLVGAAITHLRHDPPASLAAPVAFLVLVGIVVVAYRPPLLR